MITPEEIERKMARVWQAFLQAWLTEAVFFPLEVPVGKLPMQDFEKLAAGTRLLLDHSKDKRGAGYRVQSQLQRTKTYGTQNLPRKIVIETEADYLSLVKRKAKFQQFKNAVQLIRAQFPELESWLRLHPFAVLKFAADWQGLLAVCRYFCDHPRPNVYARELPLPVHTKFVEQHKGILRELLNTLLPEDAVEMAEKHFERRFGLRYDEPLIRLRFLDSAEQRAQALPFHDLSATVSELAQWTYHPRCCLIVENKLTFLTLPFLAHTLAIWGGGFRVEQLQHLTWLHDSRLYYWGDLDAHGFQILASLRHHFADVRSIMMDEITLEAFKPYIVMGTPAPMMSLSGLSPQEEKLYRQLCTANMRLEQERITPTYAATYLQKVFE